MAFSSKFIPLFDLCHKCDGISRSITHYVVIIKVGKSDITKTKQVNEQIFSPLVIHENEIYYIRTQCKVINKSQGITATQKGN